MKLLYDQNVSFRLVRLLGDVYLDSAHVRDVGLSDADDQDVWTYAATNGFSIVSKDADFYEISLRLGSPPKIIWLRRGNCTTAAIEGILRDHSPDRVVFENDPAAVAHCPRFPGAWLVQRVAVPALRHVLALPHAALRQDPCRRVTAATPESDRASPTRAHNTALATPWIFVPLLENHPLAGGDVVIPMARRR